MGNCAGGPAEDGRRRRRGEDGGAEMEAYRAQEADDDDRDGESDASNELTFVGSNEDQESTRGDAFEEGDHDDEDEDKRISREYEALRDEVLAAKDKMYRRMERKGGYQLLDNAMAKLVSPTFFGAASWPSEHQAHRCLLHGRRASAFIISDGLCDPCAPGGRLAATAANDDADAIDQRLGFGYEVFGEFVSDGDEVDEDEDYAAGGAGSSLLNRFTESDWVYTWEAQLVDHITQNLAAQGRDFLPLFQRLQECMSLEIPEQSLPEDAPPEIVTHRGTVGVLLFTSSAPDVPARIKLPTGSASLIALRLLDEAQLESIVQAKTQQEAIDARLKLVKQFTKDKSHHRISLADLDAAAAGGP